MTKFDILKQQNTKQLLIDYINPLTIKGDFIDLQEDTKPLI